MQVSTAACAVKEAPPVSLDPEEGYAARIYPGFLVRKPTPASCSLLPSAGVSLLP